MLWLALDGALGAFSAALVASDGSRRPQAARTSGNDALERGLTLVGEVLGDTALSEIGALAVGTGPGSFTGLRIAIAYAKSLAFALQIPLAGVSSYDAVAPPDAPLPHLAFVHGRPGIACVRLRYASGPRTPDPCPNGTHAAYADATVCGTYAAIAQAISAHVGPATTLTGYGVPEGAAAAFGERELIVRAAPTEIVYPALAVAQYAIAAGAPGSPHAVRADYGEAHYAERHAPFAEVAPPQQ